MYKLKVLKTKSFKINHIISKNIIKVSKSKTIQVGNTKLKLKNYQSNTRRTKIIEIRAGKYKLFWCKLRRRYTQKIFTCSTSLL